MKKKFALLFSILLTVLVLGACGTDPTTQSYNGVTYDELKKETFGAASILKQASKEEILELKEQVEFLEKNPNSNTYNIDTNFYGELTDKWLAAMEVAGKCVEVKEDSFTVTKSGKTLTTDLVIEFEKRDVTFELVFNYHDMKLTGVTVEPVYSLGEKLSTAGLNTVICMSIVFSVLILISLIIACFKFLSYIGKSKDSKETKKVVENSPVVTQIEQREVKQLTDDTELVAVIAAAIAAYTGTSTSDFVVRSIRRR